jgi:molybdopterin molybdotransferase
MPPFNKSAMDGFACRREDLENDLTIIEIIPAGQVPKKNIGAHECAKIMTGAIVPEGADCVIQVEHTEMKDACTVRFTETDTPANICRQGEDMRVGDRVQGQGGIINAQHIGVLATVGAVSPCVAKRPSVGIIATGSELIDPAEKPAPSKIRNSNSSQLSAQVMAAGAVPNNYGIAEDTEDALDAVIKKAMQENDVVLLSGGVSMGDYDLVPGILKKNGFTLLFEKIAVKPGMPTVFGVSEDGVCFGLPGNPVSTFVVFELLVKSFLYKLMGHEFQPVVVSMRLDEPYTRRKIQRDSWVAVRQTEAGGVQAIEYHGPAHLNCLSGAFGFMCVLRGVAEVKKGTWVDVRQI